ncbi:MAG: rsmE [Parachlamydiales bacterium]|nr:rsmE [Parachlamydiales bacterium]
MNDRFYFDGLLDGPCIIRGAEFHHIAHVMRIKIGEEIELVNGRGQIAQAQLQRLEKEAAHLAILNVEQSPPPAFSIILALPLLRMERLEWAIEKATELGADGFRLFSAEKGEKDNLSDHQFDRLRHMAISAMKQCGRLYLPSLEFFPSLCDAWLPSAAAFFGDTDPNAPPLSLVPNRSDLLFVSGPEKGFSSQELEFLKQHAQAIRLSSHILRAETAPIAAIALLSQPRLLQ